VSNERTVTCEKSLDVCRKC